MVASSVPEAHTIQAAVDKAMQVKMQASKIAVCISAIIRDCSSASGWVQAGLSNISTPPTAVVLGEGGGGGGGGFCQDMYHNVLLPSFA